MQIPAKIMFHNVDASDAVQKRIKEKLERLEKRFFQLVGCQVVVEAAHHHQQKGRLYSVLIDARLPGGKLVVSQHPGKNPLKHDKIMGAVNNAFAAIEKQLSRFKEIAQQRIKNHEPHWQDGVVSNIISQEGYGFLAAKQGVEVYFHQNAVEDEQFKTLDIGSKVRFVLAEGEGRKGPQASVVRIRA